MFAFRFVQLSTGGLISECTASEYRCLGDSLCIPIDRVGDGNRDCTDGSDECPKPTDFRCRCGSPLCIPKTQVMDGRIHCEDGSDEGLKIPCFGSDVVGNELSDSSAASKDPLLISAGDEKIKS